MKRTCWHVAKCLPSFEKDSRSLWSEKSVCDKSSGDLDKEKFCSFINYVTGSGNNVSLKWEHWSIGDWQVTFDQYWKVFALALGWYFVRQWTQTSWRCFFLLQGTSPSSDVLSDKGPKPNKESKGNKGGSPFEEGTGEELKHALQDEQEHESPKPTPKQSAEEDKASVTFR